MEKAEIERLMDEIVAHEAFEFNRRLKPLGISVEIRVVARAGLGEPGYGAGPGYGVGREA